MRVALVGAGLQGRRRAPVLKNLKDTELKVIASSSLDAAKALAGPLGCEASDDWQSAVARSDIDAVIICTPPDSHEEISVAALNSGKHVLCEKPLARTVAEGQRMAEAAVKAGKVLKCGFNHRHHPAVKLAREYFDRGDLGRPSFARARYGICGRPGYEKEWRADPEVAAGGHFLEQGIHAIDLFRWFLGDLTEAVGFTSTQFFKDQPLDDNGMALFRSAEGATAMLHSSLTQWKNLFSFEVFGQDGYVQVEGLGASYGVEKCIFGKRDFNGPFKDVVTEFRGADISWAEEWKEFASAVKEKRDPLGSVRDGIESLRLAKAVYESEKTGRIIRLNS